VTRQDRAKIAVTVAVPGVSNPAGTVTVRWARKGKGGTSSAAVGKGGKAEVKLPLIPTKGVYALTASYSPSAAAAASGVQAARAVGKLRVTNQASVAITAARKVKAATRAKVKVVVRVTGVGRPVGAIKVTAGGRTITAKMTAARRGKATVLLPKLAAGSVKVRATFTPARGTATAKGAGTGRSETLTVRIV
jgi:hypothetical protein